MAAPSSFNTSPEAPPLVATRREVADGNTENIIEIQLDGSYSVLVHLIIDYGTSISESILALVNVDGAQATGVPAIIANTGTGAGGSSLVVSVVASVLKLAILNSSGQGAQVSAHAYRIGFFNNN